MDATTRRIDPAERRARLARRHRLLPIASASDAISVARDLVGPHATDPASVYLSARTRVDDFTVDGLDEPL